MKKIGILVFALSILLSSCKTKGDSAPTSTATTTAPVPATTNPATTPPPIQTALETQNDQLLYLSKIFLLYSNSGKINREKVTADLEKIDNENLGFVKEFVFECTQQSTALLSDKFLKKPSKENLQLIYLLRHSNWNSMSRAGKTSALLDTFNIEAVNNEELVTAYYRLLVDGLHFSNNQNTNFAEFNIDVNALGLENNEEKAIVFYTLADHLSRRYNDHLLIIQNDCKKAKESIVTFPTFSGKLLFEAKPPAFKDFTFTLGNGAEGTSFSTFFKTNFEKGLAHYKGCK